MKGNLIFALLPKPGYFFLVSDDNEISKRASRSKQVCILQYRQNFQHFPSLHLPQDCIFNPAGLEVGHKEQISPIHGRFDAFFSLLPGWKQKELQKAQHWLQTVTKRLFQDFRISLQTLAQGIWSPPSSSSTISFPAAPWHWFTTVV